MPENKSVLLMKSYFNCVFLTERSFIPLKLENKV